MPGSDNCAHVDRTDGVCTACGHCSHDVVLNGACMACGITEFEQRIEPPAAGRDLVPLSRLSRLKSPAEEPSD